MMKCMHGYFNQQLAYFLHSPVRRISLGISMMLVLFTTFVPLASASAAMAKTTSDTKPYTGTPNTYHAATSATPPSLDQLPGTPPPVISSTAKPSQGKITHPFTPSMKPMVLPLSSIVSTSAPAVPQAAKATSSDGRLEVSVPQTALTSADIASARGTTGGVQLAVDEVAPPSGSTDGYAGSGLLFFGTYLFQLQDLSGKEVSTGIGLHQPITLTYHIPNSKLPVPANQIVLLVNPAMPATLPHAAKIFGSPQTVATQYNATTNTITAQMPIRSASSGGGLAAPAPVGYFGKPDAFQADLHTGSLTDGITIDVPRGPGDLTPDLNLSYSSESAAENHGSQATAPWVGIGWNLDPGEITWNESLDSTIASGSDLGWRSSWSISDAYGTSGPLIPSGTNVDTFYDDTVNSPATTAQTWHTAPESHARIISYTNPVTNPNFPVWNGTTGYHVQPPCFRVWLTSGIMEEFGCTRDSLQWYIGGSSQSTNYVNMWRLDLITDPNGNQIHFTYTQDKPNFNGNPYIRDSALSSVTWDAPNCHNANTMCTGSAWNPKFQVAFDTSTTPKYAAPGGSVCAGTGGLRCDDPKAQTPPAIGTPQQTNTYVLNNITVQANPSGTWNTLRNYKLAYTQAAGAAPSIDPFTGQTTSHAGHLLLEQVTETGTDGTPYPSSTFGYAYETEYYEDSNYRPSPTTNCGPVWNNGNGYGGACRLWRWTYNAYFMSTADNGQGLHQAFSWISMRTNQHGMTAGHNALDPNYCTREQAARGSGQSYPCNVPDDNGWSHMNLSERDVSVGAPTTTNPTNVQTGKYLYNYNLISLAAQECSDCTVGMYWGDANEGDWGDYYNGKFTGFAFAQVVYPDGSLENDTTYTTEGWGVWSPSTIHCRDGQSTCPNAAYTHLTNAASGHAYQIDHFNAPVNGSYPLQRRDLTTWTATCPPSGVSASNPSNGSGQRIAELDQENLVVVCDVQKASEQTLFADGNNSPTSSNVPSATKTYTYDSYGRVTNEDDTSNDASANNVHHGTSYVWDDAITTTNTSATGTYIIDRVVDQNSISWDNNLSLGCLSNFYDGMTNWTVGNVAALTRGLLTETVRHTSCGTPNNGWTFSPDLFTTTSYNANGDVVSTTDFDANAGIGGHKATTGPCTGFTTCTSYDATYDTLTASNTNALNQSTGTGYTTTSAGGFGLWPTSSTDANGQTTSTAYDGLGRTISTTLPGEGTGLTTTATSYTVWCNATGAQTPCEEVDQTQRLDGSTTVTSRTFYNGAGEAVESRTPAPGGQDVVQYAMYDTMGHQTFLSQPYFVTAYTGAPGAAAFSTPDSGKAGTTTTYDGQGRTLTSVDPNSATTTTSYSAVCNAAGTNDTACYSDTTTIDANQHQHLTLTDAFTHKIYQQDFTGNSTYALYRTTKMQYDLLGDLISTAYPDGSHQATATYDAMSHKTAYSDPDLGSYALSYDANGNQTSSVDPRGANGSVYTEYDGLNRLIWKSTNSDGSSPLATASYDSTANGNDGIGHVTNETFASGPSQTVTGNYSYIYDARGRQTGWTMSLGSTNYPFTLGYNDADKQTTLTYPDGDVLTTSYGAQDWLGGVTEQLGTTTNTLVNSLVYSGAAGASQKPTSATVGNGVYAWTWGYDLDLRLNDTNVKLVSNNNVQFDQTRSFDAVGNVVTANATLPAGTDNQTFCYDEQDRLTWAGSMGTPPCSTPLTAGTLTGQQVQYTQTYSYDVLDRLTNGPLGTGYTYGDSNHLDAVTSAPNYTASYDAAGSMTNRNGQALGYDALRRLISWQSTVNNPTSTASYAYNGNGDRVQQSVFSGGVTTTTTYVDSYEEISTTAGVTTTTKYYAMGSVGNAQSVNGTLSYQVVDDLGSVSEALTASGGVQATQLFDPFGYVRYSNGTMPTSYGFTHQRLDPSGLNYYNARYYDSSVGQFISADSVQGPNRYAHVGGNPETRTDPTGNCWIICAVVAAVVTTAVSSVVQQVTTGHINWGQAALEGAAAGLIVLAGPLVISAIGGIGAEGGVGAAVADEMGTQFGTDKAIVQSIGGAIAKTGVGSAIKSGISSVGKSLVGQWKDFASIKPQLNVFSGLANGVAGAVMNITTSVIGGQPIDPGSVGESFVGGFATGMFGANNYSAAASVLWGAGVAVYHKATQPSHNSSPRGIPK